MSQKTIAQPLVVGISGISGSGKTTLTKSLAYKLDATAVFWDDFDDISKSPEDLVAWYESGSPGGFDAWDYSLLAETINRLKSGETVISPATKEKLEPKNWIVFDAPLGKDHKQTAPYIDFWVHLNTPLDIALGRRMLRDFNAQTPAEELLEDIRYYLEKSRPMFAESPKQKMDLIVDGSKSIGIIAQEIINHLKQKYPKQFIEKQIKKTSQDTIDIDKVTFRHPSNEHYDIVVEWFKKPHVREYFDDPVTGRSIPGLRNFLDGKDYFFTPWLAFYEDKPFAYLMTAEVLDEGDDADSNIWRQLREKEGKTYSLDMLVGEEGFMGRGLGHQLIQKFIADHFQHAHAFLIDPEARNTRAIRVYEKAGFVKVGEFAPKEGQFAGLKHIMLKLKLR